jgi:glycosyltransferase involved in cell wall biosynthesis
MYASLERLKVLAESPLLERIEVIVVDDGSTDQTLRSYVSSPAREHGSLSQVAPAREYRSSLLLQDSEGDSSYPARWTEESRNPVLPVLPVLEGLKRRILYGINIVDTDPNS